jgi:hypothetical protein
MTGAEQSATRHPLVNALVVRSERKRLPSGEVHTSVEAHQGAKLTHFRIELEVQ